MHLVYSSMGTKRSIFNDIIEVFYIVLYVQFIGLRYIFSSYLNFILQFALLVVRFSVYFIKLQYINTHCLKHCF